jgi:hypothetical protein
VYRLIATSVMGALLCLSSNFASEARRVQPKPGVCEQIFSAVGKVKVVGPTARYLAASRLINQVDSRKTYAAIHQGTFERDIAGMDFSEARTIIQSWMTEYENYPRRLEELERGLLAYKDYVAALKAHEKVERDGRIHYRALLLIPSLEKTGEIKFPSSDMPESRPLAVSPLERDQMIKQGEFKIDKIEHLIRMLHRFQAIHRWRLTALLKDLDPENELVQASSFHELKVLQERMGSEHFNLATTSASLLDRQELIPPHAFINRIEDALKADAITQRIMLRKMLNLGRSGMNYFHRFWDRTGEQVDRWMKPFRVYSGIFILAGQLGAVYLVMNNRFQDFKNEIVQSDEERALTEEQRRLKELEALAFSISGESTSWSDFRERFRAHIGKAYPDEASLIWTQFKLKQRDSLEADGTYDPFYFQKAKEIDELYQVLMVGKTNSQGEMVIPGAANRMQQREYITDALNEIFYEREIYGPPLPVRQQTSGEQP